MSEDRDNKTEAASARRLEEARREGNVPLGRDAVGMAVLLGGGLMLSAQLPGITRDAVDLVRGALHGLGDPAATLWSNASGSLVKRGLSVVGACAGAAATATLAQTRGGLWWNRLVPDASRLWNPRKLKVWGADFWTDLGLASAKALALLGLTTWLLRDDFLTLPGWLRSGGADFMSRTFHLCGEAFRAALMGGVALAGADFALTRFRFNRELRMTREEVRREHKDDEGDPLIRSRRRKRHRELARGRAEVEVPRSDVLLVNPTHLALALRYRKDEGAAPRVLAKGKGPKAERMRELARLHGVAIVEDVPLARLLYRRVKVGGVVPEETYRAVAAVLAFAYRLRERAAPGARA